MLKFFIRKFIITFILLCTSLNICFADLLTKRLDISWQTRPKEVIFLGQALQDIVYKFTNENEYRKYIKMAGVSSGHSRIVSTDVIKKLIRELGYGIESPGGSANNTAVGLAALGLDVCFCASIADDKTGEHYRSMLSKYAVQKMLTIFDQPATTGIIMVLISPNGERSMIADIGISKNVPLIINPDLLKNYKIAFTEGYLFEQNNDHSTVVRFLRRAKKLGLITAFTFGDKYIITEHRQKCIDAIQTSDIVFADKEQIYEFFQSKDWIDIKSQMRSFDAIFVVTDGPNGANVVYQDKDILTPANIVPKVIDSTGAGDQFAAGFLHGFINGETLEMASKRGVNYASNIIQMIGGKPHSQDIQDKLEKEVNYDLK